MNYEDYAQIMKALADAKRVKIIDLLSCGELCACDILEHFDFTQPTLSHHMKILVDAGIVSFYKKDKWHHYSLSEDFVATFIKDTTLLFSEKESCICK